MKLLTVREAAKLLKVTEVVIRNRRARNQIPVVVKGRRVYFDEKVIRGMLRG